MYSVFNEYVIKSERIPQANKYVLIVFNVAEELLEECILDNVVKPFLAISLYICLFFSVLSALGPNNSSRPFSHPIAARAYTSGSDMPVALLSPLTSPGL